MELPARRIALLVLVAGALAVPAAALAAGGNKVKIKTPHIAHVNKVFHYTAKGRSASANNFLATFINTGVKCKKTYTAELAFNSFNVQRTSLKKGPFKVRYTVTPVSTGKHYICAYIYKNNASAKTVARATGKYTTKP
jgi:hypothetical protein